MLLSTGICNNIGPNEIRKRRLLGNLALSAGLVLAILFIWQDVDDLVRLIVIIPFFLGWLGMLQSIQKTCVFLALNGLQNQDHGNEALPDTELRHQFRIRSIWILIVATFLTLLCACITLAVQVELFRGPQGPALR